MVPRNVSSPAIASANPKVNPSELTRHHHHHRMARYTCKTNPCELKNITHIISIKKIGTSGEVSNSETQDPISKERTFTSSQLMNNPARARQETNPIDILLLLNGEPSSIPSPPSRCSNRWFSMKRVFFLNNCCMPITSASKAGNHFKPEHYSDCTILCIY